MKIEIDQATLYNSLKKVSKAVSKNATLPILSGISFEGYNDRLKLVATDLKIGIESNIKANIIREGHIVLPAQFITDIVKELPKRKIIITNDLANNTVQITSNKSKFNLYSLSASEFPLLPKLESNITLKVSQRSLKSLIRKIRFSTSDDIYKPLLAGALLVIEDDQIEIISTDTYRLVYYRTKLTKKDMPYKRLIVPNKTLKELENLLNSSDELVYIRLDEDNLSFDFSDTTIITRTIEGEFPNYKSIIPNSNPKQVVLKKDDLLGALKRATLLTQRDNSSVKFKINRNKLMIEVNSPGVGHYHEKVIIESSLKDFEVSFDANYLIDWLRVLSEQEITMDLSGPLSPTLMKPRFDNNYKYVIMPVRDQ